MGSLTEWSLPVLVVSVYAGWGICYLVRRARG